MTDALPPRDHNQPSPIERALELIKAANAGIASITAIKDAETAGRMQGFVDQLREATADLEAARAAEIEPYNSAIHLTRLKYKDVLALIDLARTKLQPMLDDWLQTLQQRIDAQHQRQADQAAEAQAEAEQLRHLAAQPGATLEQQLAAQRAQEAADSAKRAAEKPAARAAIRGDYSSKAMTMRGTWAAQIIDEDAALAHFRNHPDVRAAALGAILKLCRKLAISTKDDAKAPPGIKFTRKQTAQ